MVTGIGTVNAATSARARVRGACLRLHGARRHAGRDEPQEAGPHVRAGRAWRLPVVLFAEGGGGRPGDTDMRPASRAWTCRPSPSSRACPARCRWSASCGRCFAGNAALLGCCDVIIADEERSIGMGGPAMIEGGGLAWWRPEAVGQTGAGAVAQRRDRRPGRRRGRRRPRRRGGTCRTSRAGARWECADAAPAAPCDPENRLRVYDVARRDRPVADVGSVLELRAASGIGMVTALVARGPAARG